VDEQCEERGSSDQLCGVNAHFQNGAAERCIRDLSDGAQTLLLHAKEKMGHGDFRPPVAICG
jgi:hypothetical protein